VPLTHNNYYTMGMDQIDTLFARTFWLSHPNLAFPAFLERRAPTQRDRTDARGDLRGLSLVTAGPEPVRAKVASTAGEFAAAASLVESRYSWRGYAVQPDDRAAAITVVATRHTSTVGTLTLRADGPAGLAADEGYREALTLARKAGRRLCELTRLAIDADAAWRPTLGALIGLAYLAGRTLHEVTDVFVEVNPRHARFYQRMFGFVAAAGERFCPRVEAPAVLLRLELERLESRLRHLALFARAGGRTALAA
jgi:hypothetical protein